jgi:ligand-binding sensor domain-containing protein
LASKTSKRLTRSASLLLCVTALPACTLDFDKFEEFTEPPARIIDMMPPQPDLGDMGDAFESGDMTAPPLDMGGPDGDMDGVLDAIDNCPMLANPDQADADMDDIGDVCDDDGDNDGIADDVDNCPMLANPGQIDLDRDGQGDACDADPDGDGLDDAAELAKGTDRLRADTDADGVGDGEDTCPVQADRVGADTDGDGAGDACDPDDDGDGVLDFVDNCIATANPGQGEECAGDIDSDGVADADDTCPTILNPDQTITPCISRFETLTYLRDAHAVTTAGPGVHAGTNGGLLQIDDTPDSTDYTVVTNAQGLPGNRVRGIAIDDDGRRWLATDAGVVVLRPDGMVISMRPTDVGGGPQGVLRDLVVDSAGVLWVSSDAGVNRLDGTGWTLVTAGLPSLDARGLYADDLDRIWVATALGVVRITAGNAEPAIAALPAVGAFNNVVPAANGMWLLADEGAVLIDGADAVISTYPGVAARDLASGPSGAWLATDGGVQRIDADGRIFPAGAALLPSPDVRAAAGTPDGPRWLATANGVMALDGYFATFGPDQLPDCATTALRITNALWVGTQDGLYRMLPDGLSARVDAGLPGQSIQAVRRIGNEVWVATDAGVGVLTLEGVAIRMVVAADGIPAGTITDVVAGQGNEIWVGSAEGGIARSDAGGLNWTVYTAPANLIAGNQTRAVEHDGGDFWSATSEGVTQYDEGAGLFGPPINNSGGRLPNRDVEDIAVGGGRVFAATRGGVGQRGVDGRWGTLRRANGGLPQATRTDHVRAIAYDESYTWMLTQPNNQQPFGTLVRRDADVPPPLGEVPTPAQLGAALTLYTASNAGLAANSGDIQVDMTSSDGELFIAWCGAEGGALTVLDGSNLVTRDLSNVGLPGDGNGAALSVDATGLPLFSTIVDGVSVAESIGLDGARTPLTLNERFTRVIECASPASEDGLLCVLEGSVVARLINDAWRLIGVNEVPEFGEQPLRRMATIDNRGAWFATSNGVIEFEFTGGRTRYTQAGTGGGLPSDDVRAVVGSPDGSTLYAGTDKGVGIRADGAWTTIDETELGNADVRALARAEDGTLWIGTADGLFRRALDGTITPFGLTDGLPLNRINTLAVSGDRVFAGTDVGLAVAGPDGVFEGLGFADGLPGYRIMSIVVAPDGQVWVLSDDGIAKLL